MDEFMNYVDSVGDDWRDADKDRFCNTLNIISRGLTVETLKPDILAFFGHLDGVQTVGIDPTGTMPIMVFTADSAYDRDILTGYTFAYIAEHGMNKVLSKIEDALQEYMYRMEVDEESGEEYHPYDYPESLYDLVEFGYLDEIPTCPYTGEPITIIGPGTTGRLGDIMYEPILCSGCCGGGSDEYNSYKLVSWHITGVREKEGWFKIQGSKFKIKRSPVIPVSSVRDLSLVSLSC